jgi:hypothetical protein
VLAVCRIGSEPLAQLANAPEGSIVLALALAGVSEAVRATRQEVTAAEREGQVARPAARARADKPIP